MSKYKFIGTEQDLIDNGFELTNERLDIQRVFKKNVEHDINVFVNLDDSWGNHHFLGIEYGDIDELISIVNVDLIQDLIDKGLVEEL
jgi:hypothetical protein